MTLKYQKKILTFFRKFVFLLFISILYGLEDLPDNRLEWLLTNLNNIDLLDDEKSRVFKNELPKMLTSFQKDISEQKLYTPKKEKRQVHTGYKWSSNAQKDAYATDLLSMNNPTETEANNLKKLHQTATYTTITETVYKEFKVAKQIETQTPEWSEVVDYYGGYSGIASAGIKKSDLKRFRITKYLQKIRLDGGKSCTAIIETKGEKDYGLKFYKISNTINEIEGTTNLFDFTISDIYYIAQNNKKMNLREFRFSDLDIVYNLSLISINNKVVDIAKKYFDTIELMVDDLIPIDYYNNLIPERKTIADEQYKLASERKAESDRIARVSPIANEHLFFLSIFLFEEMARRQLFMHIGKDGKRNSMPVTSIKYRDDYDNFLIDRNDVKMKKKAKKNIPAYPDDNLWWLENYYLSIAFAILNDLPTYGWGCDYYNRYNFRSPGGADMMALMSANSNIILQLSASALRSRPIKDCEIKRKQQWTIDRKVMEAYNILKELENIDFYWSIVVDYYSKTSIDELYQADIRLAKLRAMNSEKRDVRRSIAKAQHQFLQAKMRYEETPYTQTFQQSYDNYINQINMIITQK